ncbi:MAG: hypothetical protein HY908_37455 [Myxococcales bacterium]|nr:hypothetical protein [Myxococcales bacterium]
MRTLFVAALLATLVLSGPALGQQPSADDVPAAEHAKRAQVAYDLQDWQKAIAEYQAAYAAEPRPEYMWGLAQAQRLGGDCRSAIRSYTAYRRGDVTPTQATAAELSISKCEVAVATEDAKAAEARRAAEAAKAAEVVRPAPATPPPASPPAGVGKAPGADEPTGTSKTAAWALWATTAGLTTGAVVTGVLALKTHGDYEAELGSTQASADRITTLSDRTRAFAATTDVLAGIGAVTAVVALYLTVSGGSEDEAGASANGVRLGVSAGRLSVSSSF